MTTSDRTPTMIRLAILLILSGFFCVPCSHAVVLSAQFVPQEPGAVVDLTSVGALDWTDGGYDPTNSNRKFVSPLIGNVTVIGTNVPQQVTNEIGFTWSDGTPLLSATNVFASLAINGETNGFSFEVDASTALYKLFVYVGAYAAQGQIEVTLSDDGITPAYVDASLSSLATTNGYYLIDFAAAKNNDVVTVKYTATALHDTNGYVMLHAVAFTTNAAPLVAITSPTNEENVVVGAVTTLTASAFDADGMVTNVEFFADGMVKIGEATNAPFSISWTPTNAGPQQLMAIAMDSNGAQGFSTPVTVFVTATNGALLCDLAVAPTTVNLTTEGASDWVHWGLYTETSIDRKSAVLAQISDYTILGSEPAYSFADNATSYTWTDGQPNAAIIDTPTGVYVVGLSNGFQLTLPADPNPRTLKVYVGAYGARGKFTATLSDYSAPVIVDRAIDNAENGPASVYTLNYAAATNEQTLTLTFTCDQMHDLQYGNVTLQAATLISTVDPLFLSVVAPTNNTVFSAPADIQLTATLTGGDGLPRTVEFYADAVKIGDASSSPYILNWNGVPASAYTITARTTNSLGVVQSSDPVRVFVVGSGGMINGTFAASSGSVDLTAEGTKDWVHWGLIRKNSVDRKQSGVMEISAFTAIGKGHLDQYGDNLVSYSWSDGTPTLSVVGTSTGVYIDELGSGFEMTVPADRTLRRLKVYVGLFAARGAFEATLSDFSAAPYIHSFQSVYNNATAVYTLEFAAASTGQTLTVRYTSSALFDEVYGNVTLQSATLRHINPILTPSVVIASGAVNLDFASEAGWNYWLEYTDSLTPPNWISLTNAAGTGSSIAFVESMLLSSNRFYRVRMTR